MSNPELAQQLRQRILEAIKLGPTSKYSPYSDRPRAFIFNRPGDISQQDIPPVEVPELTGQAPRLELLGEL